MDQFLGKGAQCLQTLRVRESVTKTRGNVHICFLPPTRKAQLNAERKCIKQDNNQNNFNPWKNFLMWVGVGGVRRKSPRCHSAPPPPPDPSGNGKPWPGPRCRALACHATAAPTEASEEELRPLSTNTSSSSLYNSFSRRESNPCTPLWMSMDDGWGRTQAKRGVQDPVTFTSFVTQLREQGSDLEAYFGKLWPYFHVLHPSQRLTLQDATLQQYVPRRPVDSRRRQSAPYVHPRRLRRHHSDGPNLAALCPVEWNGPAAGLGFKE